ncbi:hypothetical protein [Aneurinibacillus migulanus]|uniref:hypothetical protein n=1 Tax=Aneurinibacillus migulanus TaxID=47500 RepID=UPI00209C72FB|nr:hypothetical protein [Aneurinibacillus migulanus]MCP1357393.1 hypothetical protein [Aneurinibacillus migulanus]
MKGHANISITLNTYSHVLPTMQENLAQNFNTAMQNIKKNRFSMLKVSKMFANNNSEKSKRAKTPCILRDSSYLFSVSDYTSILIPEPYCK